MNFKVYINPIHRFSKISMARYGMKSINQIRTKVEVTDYSNTSITKAENNMLFITMGPSCSGKTSYLQSIQDICDVSLDSNPSVYEKVMVEFFEDYYYQQQLTFQNIKKLSYYDYKRNELLTEFYLITKLFTNNISFHEFCRRINFQTKSFKQYIKVIFELYQSRNTMTTKTIDIFCGHNIGKTIKTNREKLLTSSRDHIGPVASGNTNLTVVAYGEALEIASQTSRKVAFIKWQRELPVVTLTELYRRDIVRFLQSGKYVPCLALEEQYRRVSELYRVTNNGCDNELIRIAGYCRDDSGFVSPLNVNH